MNEQGKLPGLVSWTGYLALTLLLVLPLSVLTVRSGAWQQGLLLYAIACFGSALLILLSLLLLLLPRFAHWRKQVALRMLPALPGTVLVFSLLLGADVPRIHDITTDTEDPPTFAKAEQLRGAASNSLEIERAVIEQQRDAYPDIQTLLTEEAFDDAFDRATRVANELGWEIYREDRNAGIIEAVDTSAIMAFKDDIVIRIRTNAQGTLLDLRSVSRVGESDLGANAARIRTFAAAFQQQG
ncbi:MAG: DUF1499 domain-containing protein [Halioglobus sp.]|nr:DUF1499 domain-containing protein [Halioglobus sp.]